ncbi:acyl dehydratase [Halobacteriales archaeon QH_3_68_24]|nr:MAG: acyl dehydratase [Halobacteriales archaeon QH_3_68_24]
MIGPPAVSEVMRRAVETVGPDATALEAAERLHERDVGSVVVVDGGVVGIVTESDIVSLVATGGDPASAAVEAVMSAPVHTVEADETVVAAARALRERGTKKLPVTDGGDLVGIVTTTDLAHFLPHVRWPTGDRGEGDDGRVRRTERPDTAYEKSDWTFEYVGHEETIDVGDVLRFSKPLAEAEVEAFADASGDTNRLHLDEGYAAGTRFGRPVVHGTLVAGTISAALARLPGLVIYLSQEVSYLGPVDIGDRVTAECEVVEDIGDERYRLSTTVTDGDGETVVDGEAVVLADPIPETA